MTIRVVDASALVELLRRSPAGDQVDRALRGCHVVAPAHLDAEVPSALARLTRAGELDEGRVTHLIDVLSRSPIRRSPTAPFLAAAWALRSNVAMRDALYVALADRLDVELVTADRRLAAAPGLPVPVVVVGDG